MTVRLWKSKNKQNALDFDQFYCSKTLVGHDHSVSQIKVLENTQFGVSVSRDCTIKFWDLEQQMCKRTLTDDEHEWLRCVDANESYIVIAGNDTRVWAYDLKKILSTNSDGKSGDKIAQESMVNNFPAHDNVIEQISIGYKVEKNKKPQEILKTRCEHICVTASRDKQIRVFNILQGECILSLTGHENWVKDVQIIPEMSWILSVGEDKTFRIWNIDKKKQIFLRKGIHEHFVNRMIFDLPRMMVYTGSVDKICKVWGLMSENEFRMQGLS
jgi:platelet-activating factor acetylhydrolase IB subunit alpha